MSRGGKGVAAYLALAFGAAWVLWLIPLRTGFSPHRPIFQLLVLPGAFAPALAAFVVRKWVTREGFGDAGLRIDVRRWRYFALVWLLPVPVCAVIVSLAVISGLGQPDFTLHRALAALAPTGISRVPRLPPAIGFVLPAQLLITAVVATPFLFGEEFGWRGYLQKRLFPGHPLAAAAATGVIWGLWHLPLNLQGYNFPGHPLFGTFVVFPVSTILLSVIFGWVQERTDSVWAPSLAHAATNAVGGSLTLLLFAGGTDLLWVAYLGLLGWVPLGLVCAAIARTDRRRRRSATSFRSRLR